MLLGKLPYLLILGLCGLGESAILQNDRALGLVFGFRGDTVAITFGDLTADTTLVGYRIGGMDWRERDVAVQPAAVRAARHELGARVQIDAVHVVAGESFIKIPPHERTIEFIGDSLSAGMYTSYEGLSSFAYGVCAGLGDTEYYVTAYPGICVSDQNCWGNPRGQSHQWFYTSDTSWRAAGIWGDGPEPWDFDKQETTPGIVVINLDTNVSTTAYVDAYTNLVQGVHGKYPEARVVVMMGFYASGNSYAQVQGYEQELKDIVAYFNSAEYLSAPVIWDGTTNTTTTLDKPSDPFVHYLSTRGIMQHNDIGPLWHPTDVGAITVASHLSQFIKSTFGWELAATGPEIFHDTTYWNDEQNY
ncbi:hypothetical protein AAE478_008761 [Parahypoxylon ruwenzoriense]